MIAIIRVLPFTILLALGPFVGTFKPIRDVRGVLITTMVASFSIHVIGAHLLDNQVDIVLLELHVGIIVVLITILAFCGSIRIWEEGVDKAFLSAIHETVTLSVLTPLVIMSVTVMIIALKDATVVAILGLPPHFLKLLHDFSAKEFFITRDVVLSGILWLVSCLSDSGGILMQAGIISILRHMIIGRCMRTILNVIFIIFGGWTPKDISEQLRAASSLRVSLCILMEVIMLMALMGGIQLGATTSSEMVFPEALTMMNCLIYTTPTSVFEGGIPSFIGYFIRDLVVVVTMFPEGYASLSDRLSMDILGLGKLLGDQIVPEE